MHLDDLLHSRIPVRTVLQWTELFTASFVQLHSLLLIFVLNMISVCKAWELLVEVLLFRECLYDMACCTRYLWENLLDLGHLHGHISALSFPTYNNISFAAKEHLHHFVFIYLLSFPLPAFVSILFLFLPSFILPPLFSQHPLEQAELIGKEGCFLFININ